MGLDPRTDQCFRTMISSASLLILRLLLSSVVGRVTADTGPQRVDNTQPAGENPIKHFRTEYLGIQRSQCASHRDLGFTGRLGGKWWAVYGDVLWCAPGVARHEDDEPGFHGMVRDAVSLCTDDPLRVVDQHVDADGRQRQFMPYNEAWGETNTHGFGGTSLVETDAATGTGAVYYLVNANESGLVGAGIAKVELRDGTPTVTERFGDRGYWWPAASQARFGDVAAFRDPRSDYIYAWGGAPTAVADPIQQQYVYQCRVRAADAFYLARYEYWWGRRAGWRPEPLARFDAETAVLWMSGQGQVVWNDFFGCYIFVRLGPGSNDVFLRTAPAPEGPWSADVRVFTATPIGEGGLTYAGVAHPYLDETGRSLVISFTNNNNIEVIRVTFAG